MPRHCSLRGSETCGSLRFFAWVEQEHPAVEYRAEESTVNHPVELLARSRAPPMISALIL